MYYKHLQSKSAEVQTMLRVQEIFMPLLWDIIPICAIFYLHFLNFKNASICVEDCDYRQSEASFVDHYSTVDMDEGMTSQDKKKIYLR